MSEIIKILFYRYNEYSHNRIKAFKGITNHSFKLLFKIIKSIKKSQIKCYANLKRFGFNIHMQMLFNSLVNIISYVFSLLYLRYIQQS